MCNVKSKEIVTLSDLYKKINETDIYEDSMYECSIYTLVEDGQEIKLANNTCRDQQLKVDAINRIPIILKDNLGLPNVVTIQFVCMNKDYLNNQDSHLHREIRWKLSVDISDITKDHEEFIEETNNNYISANKKMENPKIKKLVK